MSTDFFRHRLVFLDDRHDAFRIWADGKFIEHIVVFSHQDFDAPSSEETIEASDFVSKSSLMTIDVIDINHALHAI
jgi:hypothetical protein